MADWRKQIMDQAMACCGLHWGLTRMHNPEQLMVWLDAIESGEIAKVRDGLVEEWYPRERWPVKPPRGVRFAYLGKTYDRVCVLYDDTRLGGVLNDAFDQLFKVQQFEHEGLLTVQDIVEGLGASEGIHEGEAAAQVIAAQAHHAAHDGDSWMSTSVAAFFEATQSPQLADGALLSLLAYGTGVEHDEVRLLRPGCGFPAQAVEAGGQLGRIGLVHLAAHRPNVIARHILLVGKKGLPSTEAGPKGRTEIS